MESENQIEVPPSDWTEGEIACKDWQKYPPGLLTIISIQDIVHAKAEGSRLIINPKDGVSPETIKRRLEVLLSVHGDLTAVFI